VAGGPARRPSPIPRLSHSGETEAGEYDLSPAQRRLWFLEQVCPGTATYTIALAFDVAGHLDVSALRDAAETVVTRHEVLRSTFREVGGVPVCRPLRHRGAGADVAEVAVAPGEDLDAVLSREATRPFDLARGPLVRLRLIGWAAGGTGTVPAPSPTAVLLACLHHLVADADSLAPFFAELARAYEGAVGVSHRH